MAFNLVSNQVSSKVNRSRKRLAHFILKSIFSPSPSWRRQTHRHYNKPSVEPFPREAIKYVHDRALNHVIEKEYNLKSVLNVKNLMIADPSNSLPLSTIVENRDSLGIHDRVVDFLRKYKYVFEEFLPDAKDLRPHFRLTPEIIELDAEEHLVYQSETYIKQAAERLLKLLMLRRIHKVPIKLIDLLKWELGLPHDYLETIVPHFPDLFQLSKVKDSSSSSSSEEAADVDVLELVCWDRGLAVSVMEERAMEGDSKGMPLKFPLEYSTGFKMDASVKKWLKKWQALPYISPYENKLRLLSNSDESDKWTVAVMHELLHILITKRIKKDTLITIGEHMGIQARIKRALWYHPGIFYISSKNRTYTVLVRDAFKRHLMVERNQMMDVRNAYVHLMHKVKKVRRRTRELDDPDHKQEKGEGEEGMGGSSEIDELDGGSEEEEVGGSSEEKEDVSFEGLPYFSDEDAADDDYDDTANRGYDGYEEDEDDCWEGAQRDVAANRRGTMKQTNFRARNNPARGNSFGRYPNNDRYPPRSHINTEEYDRRNASGKRLWRSESTNRGRSPGRSDSTNWGRWPGRSESTNWGRSPGRSEFTSRGSSPGRSESASWGRSSGRSESKSWGRSERSEYTS